MPPFQAFLDEHREAVYRFCAAAAGPRDADDCFQETMLRALRGYPRLRDARNLRAWVLTIAHRTAIDLHRGRRRGPVPMGDPPDRPAPEAGDREPALWRLVRSLPERQRAAVTLRYVGDLPYREVARAMGGSEAAARQNVRLGLERLREEWTT